MLVKELKKIEENRGTLYVLEGEPDFSLVYRFYYLISESSAEVIRTISSGSVIILQGQLSIGKHILKKGVVCFEIAEAEALFSDSFLVLLMSDEELPKLSQYVISGITFPVMRIFFVDNMPPGAVRGEHAHDTETEFLYIAKGAFEIEIREVGAFCGLLSEGQSIVSLPKAWTAVRNLREEGVLLAFLSHKYNPRGFIY